VTNGESDYVVRLPVCLSKSATSFSQKFLKHDQLRTPRLSQARYFSSVDQRGYLLLKKRDLIQLVSHRPDKNPLDSGGLISGQFFSAGFRRADEKPLAELLDGTIQHRRESLR